MQVFTQKYRFVISSMRSFIVDDLVISLFILRLGNGSREDDERRSGLGMDLGEEVKGVIIYQYLTRALFTYSHQGGRFPIVDHWHIVDQFSI